jgi:cytochrome c oxidase subunit 1
MISSLFAESGPANSGWTVYPPLSALPQAIGGSGFGLLHYGWCQWLFSLHRPYVGSLNISW